MIPFRPNRPQPDGPVPTLKSTVMKPLLLPFLFALAIGLSAQSQSTAPEKTQAGQAAQDPSKPADGPVLGSAAANAVASLDKPAINPIQDLFDITEERRKDWDAKDASSLASIKQVGKQDPCSRRIAPLTKIASDAFLAYSKAYALYVEKWSAATQGAIENLEDQGADSKKPREDYPAELQRINAQIAQTQEDLAKLPEGNPTFADARQATSNLVKALLDNKKALEEAMADHEKDEEARLAQKQLLQARLQEIDAMKKNLVLREEAAKARYSLWRSEWGMRCLAWTSKINKGQ